MRTAATALLLVLPLAPPDKLLMARMVWFPPLPPPPPPSPPRALGVLPCVQEGEGSVLVANDNRTPVVGNREKAGRQLAAGFVGKEKARVVGSGLWRSVSSSDVRFIANEFWG